MSKRYKVRLSIELTAYTNVEGRYALTRDPDGKHQVVRKYFARSPGSGVWVNFHDLPQATRDALWKKHRRKLAFPPGLQARLTAEARRAFDE
jgi:hypothetical protein